MHDDAIDGGVPAEVLEGFDREGHLSPLTIERLLAGEIAHAGPIGAHIEGCEPCRAALDGGRRFDAERRFSPPEGARRAARRGSDGSAAGRTAVTVVLLTAAAAMLVFTFTGPTPPVETTPGADIRVKGRFDLEVFGRRAPGGPQRAIDDGAAVHAGEQLAFRAQTSTAGHLLILGVDARGETYPVHPPGPSPIAAPLAVTAAPVPLEGAIEFDATPGAETLVALLCPEAVAYAAVAPALARGVARPGPLPTLVDGCQQRALRLEKAP